MKGAVKVKISRYAWQPAAAAMAAAPMGSRCHASPDFVGDRLDLKLLTRGIAIFGICPF